MMRAISLWNPWGAALAMGWKGVETRHWSTPYRGPLAIHTAKRWRPDQRKAARRLALLIGKEADFFLDAERVSNTRGAIVGVGRLVSVRLMTNELIGEQTAVERAFGNWQPGRFAWFLENMTPLEEPLKLKGRQSMWTLPKSIEDELLARTGLPGAI